VITNDGYGWQKIDSDGDIGYMALHGSGVTWSLSPVATPPDDRGARLIALAEELEGIAAKIRAEAANV
jgi:hypothetical protein